MLILERLLKYITKQKERKVENSIYSFRQLVDPAPFIERGFFFQPLCSATFVVNQGSAYMWLFLDSLFCFISVVIYPVPILYC